MALKVTLSSALLTFLIGVLVWATQPTEKAFSWVELSANDYLIGYFSSGVAPADPSVVRFSEYPAAIESLRMEVPGDYAAYAALGAMGARLVLDSGASFPLFNIGFVSDDYFQARSVSVLAGRLVEPGEQDAFVIGNALARQVFGDPASAAGRSVELVEPLGGGSSRTVEIVGVLAPSPAQDPDIDHDLALTGSLAAYLKERQVSAGLPLYLTLRMEGVDPTAVLAAIERWTADYLGPESSVKHVNADPRRQAYVERTKPRIEARRRTLFGFGAALALGALLALYAQSYWQLLRRRQLLGVDKALGATRFRLIAHLLASQLPWGVLGSAIGAWLLWSLYDFIPDIFLTRPTGAIMSLAVVVPLVALLMLALAVSVPLLRAPAMQLIRGRVEGGRVRPILLLVYGGLAIALAGGLAATRVEGDVAAEARALANQFGLMYSLQAGSPVIDPRAERAFESSEFAPVFMEADAVSLRQLPGVEAASLAQTIPNLSVSMDGKRTSAMAVAADASYMSFMGLRLAAGDNSACVLAPQVAGELRAALGDEITLAGLSGPVPCVVSGILEPHDALWAWLVADLPDVITPPLDGIGLALPGNTATPFSSTRVLLRLASPEVEDRVGSWLAATHPDAGAEVIPATPDVEGLLEGLKLQARLFSLMAALAAVLCVWGIVGGFLALLDAERFKTALDRALGLSLDNLTRRWWNQLVAWGAISASLGIMGGFLASRALYDALALDIPNLPKPEHLTLDLRSMVVVALFLVILSSVLSLTGRRWVARQSALQLLKEGAA